MRPNPPTRVSAARSAATALLLLTTLLPTGHALMQAYCFGDPCADVECGSISASAFARGSDYAFAYARAGDHAQGSYAEPGEAWASASDTHGPTWAFAEARAFWGREADASCDNGWAASAAAQLAMLENLPVGCVASAADPAVASFLGRVHAGPGGLLAAVDEERGLGLLLEPTGIRFDAQSLTRLAPIDLTGWAPTDAFAGFEMLSSPERVSCRATLG